MIDRSCTAQLSTSDRAAATVQAIVALANAHDRLVTAEGIETQAQLDAVGQLGCDDGQGSRAGRDRAGTDRTAPEDRHGQGTNRGTGESVRAPSWSQVVTGDDDDLTHRDRPTDEGCGDSRRQG